MSSFKRDKPTQQIDVNLTSKIEGFEANVKYYGEKEKIDKAAPWINKNKHMFKDDKRLYDEYIKFLNGLPPLNFEDFCKLKNMGYGLKGGGKKEDLEAKKDDLIQTLVNKDLYLKAKQNGLLQRIQESDCNDEEDYCNKLAQRIKDLEDILKKAESLSNEEEEEKESPPNEEEEEKESPSNEEEEEKESPSNEDEDEYLIAMSKGFKESSEEEEEESGKSLTSAPEEEEPPPPPAEFLSNEEEEEEQGTDNSDSSDSAHMLLGLKKTVYVPNETEEQKLIRQSKEAQEAKHQQLKAQKSAAEDQQLIHNYYNRCYNNGKRQGINGVSDVAGFQLDPNWINTAMGQINRNVRRGLSKNLGGNQEIQNQLQMVYNDIIHNGFLHAMNLYGGHDFLLNNFLAHETVNHIPLEYHEVYLYRTDVGGGTIRPGAFGRFIVGIVNGNIVCIYFIWHTGQGFTYIRIH